MSDLFSNDGDQPEANYIDQLVGEGKKFATIEDLAKGKLESDKFIDQLQTEAKGLRTQLSEAEAQAAKAATLDEVLQKLKPETDSSVDASNQSALNTDELRDMVSSIVTETEQQKRRATNRETANNNLVQRFHGDSAKAKEFVNNRAKELGLSLEQLGDMSEHSPQAFATLLGLNAQTSTPVAPSGMPRMNTEALTNFAGPAEQSVDYFRNLKKSDSKTFWSASTQQQIYKLGEKHGLDFVQKILT